MFNRVARFPEAPPGGRRAGGLDGGPRGPFDDAVDPRYPTVFVPVRDAAGELLAGVAIEVDARRYVADAMETWQAPGDFWFATDSDGHVVYMTPRAAAVLGWSGAERRAADLGARARVEATWRPGAGRRRARTRST